MLDVCDRSNSHWGGLGPAIPLKTSPLAANGFEGPTLAKSARVGQPQDGMSTKKGWASPPVEAAGEAVVVTVVAVVVAGSAENGLTERHWDCPPG